MNKSLSSMRKDFNHLRHLRVQKWSKIQIYFDNSNNHFSTIRVNRHLILQESWHVHLIPLSWHTNLNPYIFRRRLVTAYGITKTERRRVPMRLAPTLKTTGVRSSDEWGEAWPVSLMVQEMNHVNLIKFNSIQITIGYVKGSRNSTAFQT